MTVSRLYCRSALSIVVAGLAHAAAGAQPLTDQELQTALPPLTGEALPVAPPVATPADSALGTPLVPLGLAVAETPASVVVADSDAPDIGYRVEVTGLSKDQEARFKGLSALLGKGRKAENAAQIGARAEEDEALVARLLRAEGYFDAVASSTVTATADAKGQLAVTLAATPGPRYSLGRIVISDAAPEPRRYALEALELKTGDPIVAAVVESGEARIALRLPERGYPFATVGQRDILLDEATRVGDYTLPVSAGRKARFGGIRVAGDPVFDAAHIAILPRFEAGEIYDSRQVDDLRQALIGTSLLSTVAVEPVATGAIAADATETVDLLVRQTRGPARVLAASIGYGTGEGLKATASWTHRNLFPPEGALTVAAVAGAQEQGVNAQFRRSNAGQRDRAFQIGTSVARQRFEAYNAETFNLNASLSRVSTPIWQKRWTWSAGAELIASRETAFDATRLDRDRGTYFIAALPLQLGYDRSNSLLDPTRGFRLTARVSPEAQKQTSDGFEGYARTLFEASAYFPVTDAIVLAGRARVGSIVGASRDAIAPSRRLYAGGGGSVRGFGFQELGPRDINGDPLGGRSLTEFGAEVRYRFGNFGIVPFVDGGRVGEASTPSLGGMRYGAGIGGRYYTNFGPMRIDVATPLGRRPGEGRVALYISIGQAF